MATPNAAEPATGRLRASGVSHYDSYDSDDELITGEAVALDLRPASFVLRASGAIIDFVATAVLAIGLLLLVGSTPIGIAIDPAAQQALTIIMLVTLTVLVPTLVETLSHGRSLGKLAVGARIVRDDGGSIGFRHAFIRALTGFLEIFSTLGGLAAMVALLNSRSKRLGDLLAGTYSQNERIAQIVDPLFVVPPSLDAWAGTADVAHMPDRLSRRISQFVTGASGMLAPARARLAAELAAEASAYVSPLPMSHPEELLLAIIALRREREATALRLEKARMLRLDSLLGGRPHAFPDRG